MPGSRRVAQANPGDHQPTDAMNVFSPVLQGGRLETGGRTLIMGIINVTPDSFSDGGLFVSPENAAAQARRLEADGAHILDIGGESTRPFADPVGPEEELARVIPAIERIRSVCSLPVSVDTSKAAVAEAAIDAGAYIINDVTALRGDQEMGPLAARRGVPVVLMHMKGTPGDMQIDPFYHNVVEEITEFFRERISAAEDYGIDPRQIILDPGIGFGKRLQDNLEIMRRCGEFRLSGHPVLVGPSRKAFTGTLTGRKNPAQRDAATIGAAVTCAAMGCDIIRTHNVAMARDALLVADAILRGHEQEAGH